MNLSHTNRSVTVEFLAEVLVLCQALNMMFINKFMVVVLEPPHARAREGAPRCYTLTKSAPCPSVY